MVLAGSPQLVPEGPVEKLIRLDVLLAVLAQGFDEVVFALDCLDELLVDLTDGIGEAEHRFHSLRQKDECHLNDLTQGEEG